MARGRFQLKNLLPGKVSITAGSRKLEIDLDKPTTDLTIDLDETPAALSLPMRRVVLRFVGPDAGLSPKVRVAITMTKVGPVRVEPLPASENLKTDACAFDTYVPGTVIYDMKNVVGYWF